VSAAAASGVTASESAPGLFPVFLKLAGRRVLVVGGGRVALGRLRALLASGAQPTVVAPEVREEILGPDVRVERRPFRDSDVDGAWLVVAAATPDVNRAVASAATARGVFVHAVDDPGSATAYTGGVLRRGGFTIAVSTEGRAPALAGLLREALQAVLPDDASRWLELAAALRSEQRARGVALDARRPLLLRALQRLYDGPALDRPDGAPRPGSGVPS
jgi:uroporphyrin-III C-methyltransferase/precorrin-2 dehydrogenase/sirohydrochlorin ferrochelatase